MLTQIPVHTGLHRWLTGSHTFSHICLPFVQECESQPPQAQATQGGWRFLSNSTKSSPVRAWPGLMTKGYSSDLQALLRAVERLARVGSPPSQPQGGPREETQQSYLKIWAGQAEGNTY